MDKGGSPCSPEHMSGTEAGKQPYMDFWYNNTWAAEAQSDGAVRSLSGTSLLASVLVTTPPSNALLPFFREGSPIKMDYRKQLVPLF